MRVRIIIFVSLFISLKFNAQLDSIAYYLNSKFNDSTKVENSFNYINRTNLDLNKKVELFKIVENHYASLNNLKMEGLICFLMGNLYFDYSKYDVAVSHLYRALPMADKTNFLWLQSKIYNYLGIIFSDQGDSKKAVYYFRKTFEISVKINDPGQQFVSSNNIAVDYTVLGDYKKSLYFLGKAEQIIKKYKSDKRCEYLVSIYGNKLDAYINLNDTINSKRQLDSMAKYIKICNGLVNAEISYNHFNGTYYVNIKDYKKALSYFERNINLVEEGDYQEQQKLYKDLTTCYVATKQFEKAFHSQSSYFQFKDSIANSNQIRESVELEGKYNNLKIENELEISKLKNNNNELKLKRNRTVIILGSVISVIMIISLAIFIRLYRNNQRNNKLLVEKNKVIEEKQNEIIASIRYAKRIQDSMLPSKKYIKSKLNQKP
ncbi:MAG: tetratricopeptide repeat protein [Bacteroidota bacterium]|nr:tetratricopeptide repeat protein [Bacteroidota bacterium]